VGVLGLGMQAATNNADYSQNIIQAENATTSEEKVTYYSQAIDIKPLEEEAYLGMIEAFKDDAEVSTEEESVLMRKLNPNLAQLRNQESYADLAFEVGKLYWYYYDYGKTETADNQITRMKSAIQWFDDTVTYGGESGSNYVMALTYRDIGQFNRDITLD